MVRRFWLKEEREKLLFTPAFFLHLVALYDENGHVNIVWFTLLKSKYPSYPKY